ACVGVGHGEPDRHVGVERAERRDGGPVVGCRDGGGRGHGGDHREVGGGYDGAGCGDDRGGRGACVDDRGDGCAGRGGGAGRGDVPARGAGFWDDEPERDVVVG